MPPRRRRAEKQEDELPPAIWRVKGQNSTAHFTARNGKVVGADHQKIADVVVGKPLIDALNLCWDYGWKTTLIDEV